MADLSYWIITAWLIGGLTFAYYLHYCEGSKWNQASRSVRIMGTVSVVLGFPVFLGMGVVGAVLYGILWLIGKVVDKANTEEKNDNG